MLETACPDVFNWKKPVPLAIGIHQEISEATGYSVDIVKEFLRFWTYRHAYLRAVISRKWRRSASGEKTTRVTPNDKEHAARTLADKMKRERESKDG